MLFTSRRCEARDYRASSPPARPRCATRRSWCPSLSPNRDDPKVIYLETIRRQAEAEGKFIRQVGGGAQYAHVKLRLEPRERGSGYEFVDEITDGAVPPQFVEPINVGIQAAVQAGILDGYEMVDLRASLYDGSYHELDSNEITFNIAGSLAFKAAAAKASPVLLEPIMSVQVVVAAPCENPRRMRHTLFK